MFYNQNDFFYANNILYAQFRTSNIKPESQCVIRGHEGPHKVSDDPELCKLIVCQIPLCPHKYTIYHKKNSIYFILIIFVQSAIKVIGISHILTNTGNKYLTSFTQLTVNLNKEENGFWSQLNSTKLLADPEGLSR